MTRVYSSKENAFRAGAMLAGYSDLETITKILKEAEVREGEVTNPLAAFLGDDEESRGLKEALTKKAEIRTITTADGNRITLAVSPFREGYDLFVLNSKTGMGIRI